MIVIDTNVMSEAMKLYGDMKVRAWLDRQRPITLFMAATSLSELLVGIQILPAGKHQENLLDTLETIRERLFEDRILEFGERAAVAYADAVAMARSKGLTISMPDGQIAAIATVHGFSVATRDIAPFLAAGVPVINPWLD